MFDLLLDQIAGIVWLDGLAVVAHAVGAVSAHSCVARSLDLAILFVQSIVDRQLLDSVPRVVDTCLSSQVGNGDGGGILGSDFLAVQSVGVGRSGRLVAGRSLTFAEFDEDLGAISAMISTV